MVELGFFNIQGQRDIVRSKLWEEILFDLEYYFWKYMLKKMI